MKKKIFIIILCLMLLTSCFTIFAGCSEKNEPLTIVYLGDSIAEAIAGPSPLSERDWYGYYALLGKCNEYNFYNRSVSGHKSSQMLEIVKEEDKGAAITHTMIKNADILHISILGNDVLQDKFNPMIVDAAENDFTAYEEILTDASINFADIITELKKLNPDAIIIIQTIYNPGDPACTLINPETKAILSTMGFDSSTYRGLAKELITRLNSIILDYLAANPGAYYISDVYTAFDNIYKADREHGNDLIFTDWIHPSNYGHAVAAYESQKILQDLGLANAGDALALYKELRTAQLSRLYSGSVDVAAITASIEAATTYQEVTEIYFVQTEGYTPVYC